jgi:hypothetical protein
MTEIDQKQYTIEAVLALSGMEVSRQYGCQTLELPIGLTGLEGGLERDRSVGLGWPRWIY